MEPPLYLTSRLTATVMETGTGRGQMARSVELNGEPRNRPTEYAHWLWTRVQDRFGEEGQPVQQREPEHVTRPRPKERDFTPSLKINLKRIRLK